MRFDQEILSLKYNNSGSSLLFEVAILGNLNLVLKLEKYQWINFALDMYRKYFTDNRYGNSG